MSRNIGSRAFGRRVGLTIEPEDEAVIRPLLPHWWVESDGEPDAEWQVPSADSARFVIRELELWVGEHATEWVFLHSAVVAVDGRGILLPGRSFCGKTTLTEALLRAGASYGSDEYAVLRPDGLVEPYPRPLAVRTDEVSEPSADKGSKTNADEVPATNAGVAPSSGVVRRYVPASELGAVTLTEPVPIKWVVFARFEPAGSTGLHPIPAGDGVLALLDNALASRRRPEFVLDALLSATARARWFRGTRGAADPAADEVLAIVAGRSGPQAQG